MMNPISEYRANVTRRSCFGRCGEFCGVGTTRKWACHPWANSKSDLLEAAELLDQGRNMGRLRDSQRPVDTANKRLWINADH